MIVQIKEFKTVSISSMRRTKRKAATPAGYDGKLRPRKAQPRRAQRRPCGKRPTEAQ
ncbi:hypothetical protein [Jeotgalibacillus proteolyticus]|uniref:hypothetical protein n=1 Tax=Jeotgalibacillus proteolyticus TaxID=2082395 RepID=UPI003CF0507F